MRRLLIALVAAGFLGSTTGCIVVPAHRTGRSGHAVSSHNGKHKHEHCHPHPKKGRKCHSHMHEAGHH